MKIVINRCYGGFGLSEEAMLRYCELKGIKVYVEVGEFDLKTYWKIPEEERIPPQEGKAFHAASRDGRIAYNNFYRDNTIHDRDIERNDINLVKVVEELGSERASGKYAKLAIVDVPDDVEWAIDDYDGMETVEETHRSWS